MSRLRETVTVARWIATNEGRRAATDKMVIGFGLIVPVLIITLIGTTFGSVSKVRLGVLDESRSPASAELIELLDDEDVTEVNTYTDPSNLRRDVRAGNIDAGIRIPASYDPDLESGAAGLEALVDPASTGVGTALATVQAVANRVGMEAAAIQLVEAEVGRERLAQQAVAAASRGFTPVETRDSSTIDRDVDTGQFSYVAPANLALFAFTNTFAASMILVDDRRRGMIHRVLATPHRSGDVLLGLGVSKFVFSVMQSTVLVVVGTVLFSVRWGSMLGAALLILTWCFVATTFGLLIATIARESDQAQAIGIPITIALGMLGGCMWPLDIVPEWMRVAGHVSPHAWVMDGWEDLIFEGGGVGNLVPELAVLVGMALVLGSLAARRLRRSVTG